MTNTTYNNVVGRYYLLDMHYTVYTLKIVSQLSKINCN